MTTAKLKPIIDAFIEVQLSEFFNEQARDNFKDKEPSYTIIKSELSYKIQFQWTCLVDKHNECHYQDDYFTWLKSEPITKLWQYLSEQLETITNTELVNEYKGIDDGVNGVGLGS